MGSTGLELARVTSAESPNGLGGRSLAATPPLRGGIGTGMLGFQSGGVLRNFAAVAHIFCMGMTVFCTG